MSKEIISPAGLYAARWLAAYAMVGVRQFGDDFSPEEALNLILGSVRDRIGSRGEWLNSWTPIGQRLVGEAYNGLTGDSLYRARV